MGTHDAHATSRGSRPEPSRTSAEQRDRTNAGVGRLVWPIAITLLTAATVHVAFSVERAGTVWFWTLAAAPSIVVGAFALMRAHRDGELAGWLKPVWGDPTRGILSAILLVGAGLAFVHVV